MTPQTPPGLAAPAAGSHRQPRRGLLQLRWPAGCPPLLLPLALLILGTVIFRLTAADLALSRPFYDSAKDHWTWMHAQPWRALYLVGCYPGLMLGIGGLIVGLTSLWLSPLRRWRKAGLFFALLLALGPGLLVNGLLKPGWGRPRPRQVVEFGGNRSFLPVGQLGASWQDRSFPSGHASMGFYLMAPGFVLYRRRRRLALAFFLLGLVAGGIIGAARIVQGGHFASDVLWSAGFVYLTGLLLVVVLRPGAPPTHADARQPSAATAARDLTHREPTDSETADKTDYRKAA